MHKGHLEDAWQHTSALMSLIANASRDPKRRPSPYVANDFNPFSKSRGRKGEPLTVGTLDVIRRAIRERNRRQ